MNALEKTKKQIMSQLSRLCAHCVSGKPHKCPVQSISAEVSSIHGVPLLVNNEFRGVLWR